MAIRFFFCTLEYLLEMTTMLEMTTLSEYLEAQPMTSLHKDRLQISIRVYSGKPRTINDLKNAIREEMRAVSRSVCKDVTDNFVLRLKKCTRLNGSQLEKML